MKAKVVRDNENRIIAYAIIGNIENSIEEQFESIEQLEEEFKAGQEAIKSEEENNVV